MRWGESRSLLRLLGRNTPCKLFRRDDSLPFINQAPTGPQMADVSDASPSPVATFQENPDQTMKYAAK